MPPLQPTDQKVNPILTSLSDIKNAIAELAKPKLQKVEVITREEDALTLTEIDYVSTTAQKKQDKADLTFDNPLKKDGLVTEYSVIPLDQNSKDKGMIEIFLDGVRIYRTKQVLALNVAQIVKKYNKGKSIKDGKKVELFAWNGTDNTAVKLVMEVSFSEVV